MSDKESNVLWPERFRVPAMDEDQAEEMAREVAEWDAYLAEQPHIKRLLQELRALPEDELFYILRVIFGAVQGVTVADLIDRAITEFRANHKD